MGGKGAVALAGLVLAGSVGVWLTMGAGRASGASAAALGPALATVEHQSLTSQLDVSGTLGYTGNYTVVYPSSESAGPGGSSATPCSSHPGSTTTTTTTVPAPTTSTSTSTTVPLPTTTSTTVPMGSSAVVSPATTVPASTGQHQPSGSSTPCSTTPSKSTAPTGTSDPSAAAGASGTITALPAVGQLVTQGQSLYSVDGAPVVLLYGDTPAWRTLSLGVTGRDVTALNADLVTLGDATASELSPTSDVFSSATETAVKALQANLGAGQTGRLTLGQVAFLPSEIRVITLSPTVGSAVSGGGQILQGTSTTRQVTFALDATQLSEIKVGDAVTITLPNGRATPGMVSAIGTTASTATPPTVTVDVTPIDPAATGSTDQDPVALTITTGSVNSVLAVPVAALSATADGHAALQLMGTTGLTLDPISIGLFDDATGMVQVSGAGLAADDHVVVPRA